MTNLDQVLPAHIFQNGEENRYIQFYGRTPEIQELNQRLKGITTAMEGEPYKETFRRVSVVTLMLHEAHQKLMTRLSETRTVYLD